MFSGEWHKLFEITNYEDHRSQGLQEAGEAANIYELSCCLFGCSFGVVISFFTRLSEYPEADSG